MVVPQKAVVPSGSFNAERAVVPFKRADHPEYSRADPPTIFVAIRPVAKDRAPPLHSRHSKI